MLTPGGIFSNRDPQGGALDALGIIRTKSFKFLCVLSLVETLSQSLDAEEFTYYSGQINFNNSYRSLGSPPPKEKHCKGMSLN